MTILHFVTLMVFPQPGGLEASLLRIAKGFAAQGFGVIIYTLGQPEEHAGPHPDHEGIEVVHLAGEKHALQEPFEVAGDLPDRLVKAHGREKSRLQYLVLENAIERRMAAHSDARHLIVSFYASSMGFVAQQVAARLDVPHVASIRGPEYCVDYRSSQYHGMVRFVIENADLVVTTNREQAEVLSRLFRVRWPMRTIHNATEAGPDRPFWNPPLSSRIELVCDSGFSGRKATHLLLRAVTSLLDAGLPVRLTVLGGIFWQDNQHYWTKVQRECQRRYPDGFHFPGRVPPEAVEAFLAQSHLYCSATLGEGCSLSRLRALTLGMPMVTTRCGALPEATSDCDHVRLCRPGDWEALAAELELMVQRLREESVHPDRQQVAAWREHFSPPRERGDWAAAIREALRR